MLPHPVGPGLTSARPLGPQVDSPHSDVIHSVTAVSHNAATWLVLATEGGIQVGGGWSRVPGKNYARAAAYGSRSCVSVHRYAGLGGLGEGGAGARERVGTAQGGRRSNAQRHCRRRQEQALCVYVVGLGHGAGRTCMSQLGKQSGEPVRRRRACVIVLVLMHLLAN